MIEQELKDKIKKHFEETNYNYILKCSLFGSNSINREKLKKNKNFTKVKNDETRESDVDILLVGFHSDFFTKLTLKENLSTYLKTDIKIDLLYLTLEYYNKHKESKSGLLSEIILTEEVLYLKKIGNHYLG